PGASFTVIDRSAENIAVARALAPADVRFEHAAYDPALVRGFDVVVFPLAFSGDRRALYRDPSAPVVFVHDWLWHRRGTGAVVSFLLLKRLNLALWHGLPTVPRGLTEGLQFSAGQETFGRAEWHGQETVPQRGDRATARQREPPEAVDYESDQPPGRVHP